MKLENIWSKLQSSFILLPFVHLSALHYTTMDRITETDQGIIRSIEVTLEEEICDPHIRIIEVKILEVDTKGITETLLMKKVGVDLGIDNIQIIPE